MNDTINSTLAVIPKTILGTQKYLVYIAPAGKSFAGQYRFVGGKIKTGEDYVSTLQREFMEEYNVSISNIELLYRKNNILGGEFFLCNGTVDGIPTKNEADVGIPEWKTAEELFASNLVPNCKINLYAYLLKTNLEKLNSLIPTIQTDSDFIDFLSKEASDLHADLVERLGSGAE